MLESVARVLLATEATVIQTTLSWASRRRRRDAVVCAKVRRGYSLAHVMLIALLARGAVRAIFVVPLTEQKWPNGGCCQRMWNKTSNLSGSCFFLPDVFTASRSPPVVLNFQAGLEWTATICESVTSSSPAPDDPDGPMPDVFLSQTWGHGVHNARGVHLQATIIR